jgi:hypothetical protein
LYHECLKAREANAVQGQLVANLAAAWIAANV